MTTATTRVARLRKSAILHFTVSFERPAKMPIQAGYSSLYCARVWKQRTRTTPLLVAWEVIRTAPPNTQAAVREQSSLKNIFLSDNERLQRAAHLLRGDFS
jgi:hypothetical protein